ncbi:MAG: hypothetical protein ACE5KT_08240 [Methanosarcinales archaeon]
MIELVTRSGEGNLIIPKEVLEKIGVSKVDKFILVSDNDTILLKTLKKTDKKKDILNLLDYFADRFAEKGITENEIEKLIEEVRKSK